MKKTLSVLLVIVLMVTLLFPAVLMTAAASSIDLLSAAESTGEIYATYTGSSSVSLLPPSASDFTTMMGGDGTITVSAEGNGYRFSSDYGWPSAYYWDESSWITVNENDSTYLNYDFEVLSGATSIIVYFCGQNPADQATPGSFVCLNGLVDPSYVNPLTGDAVMDLPAGHYSGSVRVSDLGCRADLMVDGNFVISGCKVFAVGGTVLVNDLSVGTPNIGTVDTTTVTKTTTTIQSTATMQGTATTTMVATGGGNTSSAGLNLLPPSANNFTTMMGGDGTITVSAEGNGYRFSSDYGWPSAYYWDESSWITVNVNDDAYLNFDFEVLSGATNIIVYFAGQNPADQAIPGSFICLNGLVDPSYINPLTGDAVMDLPAGKYSGSVKVGELGCREDLMIDGNFVISGFKVFAVGGTVIVNELSVITDNSINGTTEDGFEYSGDSTNGIVITGYNRTVKSAVIPAEIDGVPVVTIGEAVFADQIALQSVTIPASVKTIKKGAFEGCTALTDIYYGGSEAMWENVILEADNAPLLLATLHPTETVLGDLTSDGIIDMFDAMMLYTSVSGMGSLSDTQKAAADFNGDNTVDMFDALALYMKVSGQ